MMMMVFFFQVVVLVFKELHFTHCFFISSLMFVVECF